MKSFAYLALSIFLLAASASALMIARSVAQLRIDANTQLTLLNAQVKAAREDLSATEIVFNQETGQLVDSLADTLEKARKNALSESAAYRQLIDTDWARTVHILQGTVDMELASIASSIDDTNAIAAQAAGAGLSMLKPVAENLDQITANLETISARVNTQEPMIYSRYLAVSGELMRSLDAMRRTSEEVAIAAPAIAANVTELTGDAALVAADVHHYTKPKGFIRGTLLPIMVAGVHFIF